MAAQCCDAVALMAKFLLIRHGATEEMDNDCRSHQRPPRGKTLVEVLGRSVSETLRLVQALQTGERCPVEWKPGAKTLGKPGK